MWTFTAILGTALCRPGNIVLATAPSAAGPIYADASISGGSSIEATAERVVHGHASILGLAHVTAVGTPSAFISAALTGSSSLTVTVSEGYPISAVMVATAIFFIDPSKVLVMPFIKPTTVRTVPNPAVIVAPEIKNGPIPNKFAVGPTVTVPKTRVSGVQNKG